MRYVVLGATGGIGHAVARRAADAGHTVRAVARNPSQIGGLPPSVERAAADALDLNQVISTCQGADVVVHGVNVPYQRWPELVPRIAANILQAAETAGAILAFPGNVYPYGHPQQNPVLENHPVNPCSTKGEIRARIEADYLSAHAAKRVRLVLPRYPDFYGPYVVNGLYSPIFDGAIAGRRCRWPIDADRAHEFIYIDDAADALLRLVDTPAAHGVAVHVPGPGTISGREFVKLAYAAGGHPPRVQVFGRGLWRLAGLFNAEARGAYEMAYLFQESLILGDGRYTSFVGTAPPATPYAQGVQATLEWYRSPERTAVRAARGH